MVVVLVRIMRKMLLKFEDEKRGTFWKNKRFAEDRC